MARTKRAPDPWYQELQRAEQRSRSLGRWSTVNSRSSPSIPVQPVSTTERIESPTSPIENGPTIFSSSPPASAKEGLANNQSPSMPIITSNPTPSLGVLGGAQILLLLPPESHEEPSLVQQARARIFEGLSLLSSAMQKVPLEAKEPLKDEPHNLGSEIILENVDASGSIIYSPSPLASSPPLGLNSSPDLIPNEPIHGTSTQSTLQGLSAVQIRSGRSGFFQREGAPATEIPSFRPVANPFICQRAYFGDGSPCPYQRECVNCDGQRKCNRRDCTTAALNNFVKGNSLGPSHDIKSPLGNTPKMCRTSIKHYFGRNKKGSNYINFDDTLLCRKCYQHLSYISKRDPEHKWAKMKSEILYICVERVEEQQQRRTGKPGVWLIQLKKTEKERLDLHYKLLRTGINSFQRDGPTMSALKQGKMPSEEKSGSRKQMKGTYEAPIEILKHIDDTWCGYGKTVQDCREINNWCRSKLTDGSITDLPLWEHVPLWDGDEEFQAARTKGPSFPATPRVELNDSDDDMMDIDGPVSSLLQMASGARSERRSASMTLTVSTSQTEIKKEIKSTAILQRDENADLRPKINNVAAKPFPKADVANVADVSGSSGHKRHPKPTVQARPHKKVKHVNGGSL